MLPLPRCMAREGLREVHSHDEVPSALRRASDHHRRILHEHGQSPHSEH